MESARRPALEQLKRRVKLRYRARAARRLFGRSAEIIRYGLVRPATRNAFHIVSTQRNAGEAAERCLDSVHRQRYDRSLVRHVYIDDASSDDTRERVGHWLSHHPDHTVDYRPNAARVGGTRNTLDGYALAAPGSIVVELNGDDWLPDSGVLEFLNKVYADPDVWITYNTCLTTLGHMIGLRPIPADVARRNAFRSARWHCGPLRTFRMELMAHMDPGYMIDPQTNDYWANADDQAFFLSLLELAGPRTRHIYRLTYVYNMRHDSEFRTDDGGLRDRVRRMRSFEPLRPLDRLGSS